MPTYRSITLSLVSQFDILTIPEFAPPTTPNDPFSNAPTLINPDHSLVSVYIPTYPASQFWLSYSISPPHPPKLLYYFKLYINNNLIVNWGCGEEDGYKGKTMFGLYDSVQGRGFIRQALIERRVLCFSPEAVDMGKFASDNLGDVMEIKVFRSKGRKRISPDIQEYQSSPSVQHVDKKCAQQQAGTGINLVNAGFLSAKHPKRFYKYALLDPLDTPFATFRYYCRTWDQLEALGVISPTTNVESSSIRSQTPMQRPLSPQSCNNTLQSFVSFMTSYESLAAQIVTSTAKEPSEKNKSTDPITGDKTIDNTTENTTDSTTETSSPTGTDEISPLKVPPLNPLRMHRPPTPPPTSTPSKTLAQLPPSILSTLTPDDQAGHTLTPKESFTTLIRTRLPSPDPSAFQLKNPSDEDMPRPPSPLRTRSTSMGALMNAVASAKTRRNLRRGSEESGLGLLSGSSEGEGGKTDDGTGAGKDRLVEMEREKKRKAKEEKKNKKKCRDEGGYN